MRLRAMEEPLEAGKLHIGERRPGGNWQDRTQAQIEQPNDIASAQLAPVIFAAPDEISGFIKHDC